MADAEGHIVIDRQPRHQARLLEDEADLRPRPGHRRAVDLDPALGRHIKSGDKPEQ